MKRNKVSGPVAGASVREAIDASLSGVRFGDGDERAVWRAVNARGRRQRGPRGGRKRAFRLQPVFALTVAVIAAAPLCFSLLRARDERIVSAAPGGASVAASPNLDATLPPTPGPGEASAASVAPTPEASVSPDVLEAVTNAARACFEAECDASVFGFDEFSVSISAGEPSGGEMLYTVTLDCVYDNGCSFTALVAYPSLEVLQHSSPELATNPTFFGDDGGMEAFYERYGPYPFCWDGETQAEFSRRYDGGACRLPAEGELTREQAAEAAKAALISDARFAAQFSEVYAYPMLYDRQASGDGVPRYLVYCFAQPVTDALSDPCALVTLRAADGAVESVQAQSARELSQAGYGMSGE